MTELKTLRKRILVDPEVSAAYEDLAPEFELARVLISARTRAGLTQSQVAKRMNTTQSAVARLEGGRVRPSSRTIERYAAATGTRVQIVLVPLGEDDERPRPAVQGARGAKTGRFVSTTSSGTATEIRSPRGSAGAGRAASKKAG